MNLFLPHDLTLQVVTLGPMAVGCDLIHWVGLALRYHWKLAGVLVMNDFS
jgi:hypothetical protein